MYEYPPSIHDSCDSCIAIIVWQKNWILNLCFHSLMHAIIGRSFVMNVIGSNYINVEKWDDAKSKRRNVRICVVCNWLYSLLSFSSNASIIILYVVWDSKQIHDWKVVTYDHLAIYDLLTSRSRQSLCNVVVILVFLNCIWNLFLRKKRFLKSISGMIRLLILEKLVDHDFRLEVNKIYENSHCSLGLTSICLCFVCCCTFLFRKLFSINTFSN